MADYIRSFTDKAFHNTLHSNDRILRWPEVQKRVGLCRSHVHALAAKEPPKFPPPFKICEGGRASGWWESSINTWLDQRAKVADPSDPEAAHGAGHE